MDTVWTPSAADLRAVRKSLLADLLPDTSPAARVEIFARAMGAHSDAALCAQERAIAPSYPPTTEAARHLAQRALGGHPLVLAVEANVLAQGKRMAFFHDTTSSNQEGCTEALTAPRAPGWWMPAAEAVLGDALPANSPESKAVLDAAARDLHRHHQEVAALLATPQGSVEDVETARTMPPPTMEQQATLLRASRTDLAWFHARAWADALVPDNKEDHRIDRTFVRLFFVASVLVDRFLSKQPMEPYRTKEGLQWFLSHHAPTPDLWQEAQEPWAYDTFDRLAFQITRLAQGMSAFDAYETTQRLSRSCHTTWALLQGLAAGNVATLPPPRPGL